ncbi:MAG: glycoside hydrolase family 15 protein [Dehalococcoidia bacterium]|nr:MAG: glycoside hydrolase family 15 protein [Dehalococcoidia bacterium]
MGYKPISDYGIIGNMLSAALVGKDGSIDWCCLPRFDSPSVFAAILDDEKGGQFQITPRGTFESSQSYLPDTNVLQTTFESGTGVVTLTDFMPCYRTARGRLVQFPEIHRLVYCNRGSVDLQAVFEPRLDYARALTVMGASKYGVAAKDGARALALSSTIPFAIQGNAALGHFTLQQGGKAWFILCYASDQPRPFVSFNSAAKLEKTSEYWRRLAEGCIFSGPWRDAILRSYLALHLMIYSPTGAIVAAPTTSLPEEIGGERNWDYRYAWLRDSSLTINAFAYLGHGEEANGFMKWLLSVCDKCGPKAQILYDIDFQDPLHEQVLDHLRGYRDSRPVRIGNGAYQQRQLDVFGEVLEAAYSHLNIGHRISRRSWALLESFVNAACELWRWPDSGIWEVRGGPYHFVHSKLMCWVAVDRGIKIAEKLGRKRYLRRWRETAQEIRDDILKKGWNPKRRAFTQHYDTAALDSSNLLMPLFGFLPVSDERVVSTIERTVEELDFDGLLRRYRTDDTDDGLSGSEGAFLWCSFWLVRVLLRLGRLEQATDLYQRLLGYSNHLNLLSEMVDPASGEALGNFPQALTHLAVIITGLELSEAMRNRGSGGGEA